MLKHQSAKRCYLKHEVIGKDHQTVLVVETDLELDPDHPKFDSSAFDDLVNEATELMASKPSVIDRIDVLPH